MSGTRGTASDSTASTAPAATVYATSQDIPKASRKKSALKTSATIADAVEADVDVDVDVDVTEEKGKKSHRKHRKEKTSTEDATSHKESKSRKSSKSGKKNKETAVIAADDEVDASLAATSAATSDELAGSPTVESVPLAALPATPPLSKTPPKNVMADLERAAAALSASKAEAALLVQQEEKAKKARDNYENIMRSLEEDRQKALKRANDAESKVKELEQALKMAQEDLEAQKEDASASLEQKDVMIRSHEVQIGELEAELEKAQDEYQAAKAQIAQLHNQLEIANDRLPLLEAQLAVAERAREEAERALEESREEHQTQLELSERESEEASDEIAPEKPRPRTKMEKVKVFFRTGLSVGAYALFGIAVGCAIAFGLMFWQVTIPVVGVFLAQAIGPALTALVYAAVISPVAAGLALGVKKFFDWAFSDATAPAAEAKSKRDDVSAYLEVDEAQELSSSAKLQAALGAGKQTKQTDTRPSYQLEVVDKPKSVGERFLVFLGKKEKPKTDEFTVSQDRVNSPYSSPSLIAH